MEAVEDGVFARMEGTQGIADPNSPVILVNETSGRTATVLSSPDGSFTNFIAAAVDDFLSAIVVNQNGTRTTIPVSRQVFTAYPSMFCWNSLVHWQLDGADAWGEDQDVWHPRKWRDFAASLRG